MARCVQALPRAVELAADGADIVQWPVEEVDALREHAATLRNVTLPPGARLELPGVAGQGRKPRLWLRTGDTASWLSSGSS